MRELSIRRPSRGKQVEQFLAGLVDSRDLPVGVDEDDAGRRSTAARRCHRSDQDGAAHPVRDLRVDVEQERRVVVIEVGAPAIAV